MNINKKAEEIAEKFKQYVVENKEEYVEGVQSRSVYLVFYDLEKEEIVARERGNKTILVFRNESYAFWEPEIDSEDYLENFLAAIEDNYISVDDLNFVKTDMSKEQFINYLRNFEYNKTEITEEVEEVICRNQATLDTANLYLVLDRAVETAINLEFIEVCVLNELKQLEIEQ